MSPGPARPGCCDQPISQLPISDLDLDQVSERLPRPRPPWPRLVKLLSADIMEDNYTIIENLERDNKLLNF